MKKFLKRRWYVIALVVVVVAFLIYRNRAATVKSTGSDTYKVKRTTIKDTLSLSGNIDAHEQATLQFPSSGKLTWVGVKEGDFVHKGQGIASIDARDVQKRMQKYLNTYAESRLTFDQSKDDNREVVIGGLTPDQRQRTQRAFQKVQYDLNNAVLDVELQQLAAEDSYLASPIEGLVTHIDTPNAGVNITPTSGQFVIVNPDSVYFSALADQTDVVRLSQGMDGQITFDSFPDRPVSGVLDTISYVPKSGETGTVYEVKISLAGQDVTHYRLGMTGDVEFTLGKKENILAVPLRFVKSESDNPYVYKLVDGKPVKTNVKTGETSDELIEVKSGLKEGDVVYDKAT